MYPIETVTRGSYAPHVWAYTTNLRNSYVCAVCNELVHVGDVYDCWCCGALTHMNRCCLRYDEYREHNRRLNYQCNDCNAGDE